MTPQVLHPPRMLGHPAGLLVSTPAQKFISHMTRHHPTKYTESRGPRYPPATLKRTLARQPVPPAALHSSDDRFNSPHTQRLVPATTAFAHDASSRPIPSDPRSRARPSSHESASARRDVSHTGHPRHFSLGWRGLVRRWSRGRVVM